jgi:WXXGXW repeat (2 copies)
MRIQTLALGFLLLLPKLALAQIEVQAVVPSITVNAAPPPMRVEVQTARPSPNHVWLAGHWGWEGNAHVWVGGHWAIPPSPNHVWVPARWVNRGGRWVFWQGHWDWRAPAQGAVVVEQAPGPEVVVQQAPPADIVEVQPVRPSPNHVWLAGHWYWNGSRYQWAGGHWEGGRVGFRWEPAHWQNGPGGYRFVGGHWRR